LSFRGAAAGATILAVLLSLVAAERASTTVIQSGGLRVTLLSQVMPRLLPRREKAPIAVFVSGHVAAVKQGVPPQLRGLTIDVNRHGHLDAAGAPVCDIRSIQAATTSRAVRTCGDAIVGSGQFWAHIVLDGQVPYPTRGRLLVFNGRRQGKPVVLTHIYTENPFATSFVIPFEIHRLRGGGPYGTRLTAALPKALGDWGYVDRIKLTLRRTYRRGGRTRGYFSANCPAPSGSRTAVFPLARADFAFAFQRLTLSVPKSCGVKGE
jgi:hypothetical protein